MSPMILIEDDIHCDRNDRFACFEDAVAELKRRASIPWDRPPNLAPYTDWKTCGWEYHIVEMDDSHEPWKSRRSVAVLNVSAKGAQWVSGFEQAWAAQHPPE